MAKQLSGHVLLDYGIFMDFRDVLCCGLAVFFVSPNLLRPSSEQMEHWRGLEECCSRLTEFNSLGFVNGVKILKVSKSWRLHLVNSGLAPSEETVLRV